MDELFDAARYAFSNMIALNDACNDADREAARRALDERPADLLSFMGLVESRSSLNVVDDAPSATSSTSDPVSGADEADIIKNDGEYIYAAMGSALHILSAKPAAATHEIARVPLAGTAKKLFVVEDRALVYVASPRDPAAPHRQPNGRNCTYAYDCAVAGDGTATAMLIFDIADRTRPVLLRRIDADASLIAARRIGNVVHTVLATQELSVPTDLSINLGIQAPCSFDQTLADVERARAEVIAAIEAAPLDARAPAVREGGRPYVPEDCSWLFREGGSTGAAFTTLISLDINSGELNATGIVGRPGGVYAAADALYVGVPIKSASYDRRPDSVIHEFAIGDQVKDLRYVASGRVEGRIFSQFAMDERDGYLRVATTKGRMPDPEVQSLVSVMKRRGDVLALVGQLDGIAPGEDIRSVRFEGDRAFMVTSTNTAPLYTIDVSDPKEPSFAGEFEIPGFSTDLHMFDESRLLSVGYDVDDQGNFDSVMLQLFDLGDASSPELLHKTVIGTRGSSAEAQMNQLAFTLFENKLALPMTICEGDSEGEFGSDVTFSGLIVYDVGLEQGIQERGRVAHPNAETERYDDGNCKTWWSKSNSVVRRSMFMDDYVYSIATDMVRVQSLDDLGRDVATVSLH